MGKEWVCIGAKWGEKEGEQEGSQQHGLTVVFGSLRGCSRQTRVFPMGPASGRSRPCMSPHSVWLGPATCFPPVIHRK